MRSKLLVRRTVKHVFYFLMTNCHPPCYLSAPVLDSSQLSDGSCLFDIGKFE